MKKLKDSSKSALGKLGYRYELEYNTYPQCIDHYHSGFFWYCHSSSEMGPLVYRLMKRESGLSLRYHDWSTGAPKGNDV